MNDMKRFLWIWCLINTVGVLLAFITIGCDSEVNRQQDIRIQELETQLKECQSILSVQPDTVVINIYNNITSK